jgi:metal-responsive CopG/Arc/MetJ family transcriptional regulator
MSLEVAFMGEKLKDQRIPVMMSTDEVDAIDEWRRKQEDLPSRSEAIRRLVALSLKGRQK